MPHYAPDYPNRAVVALETAWKASKYEVFSVLCFPVLGPDQTPYLDIFHAVNTEKFALISEVYSEANQTSKMELLNVFAKRSILNVWPGFEFLSEYGQNVSKLMNTFVLTQCI